MVPANYEYQSDFARKYFFQGKAEGEAEGRAEGEAKGKAELLLRLIDRKGIAISDDDRRRVLNCTDVGQIESWFDCVVTATHRDQIFEG